MTTKKASYSLWNIKDIIILQFIAFVIGEIAKTLTETFSSPETPFFFLFPLLGHILFLGILLVWVFYFYELPVTFFGLTLDNLKKGLNQGLKAGIPFLVMIIFLVNFPLSAGEAPSFFQPLIKVTDPDSLTTSLLYFIFFAAAIFFVALAVELFYRGVVGHFLERKLHPFLAIIVGSSYFSLFWGPFQPGWLLFNFLLALLLFFFLKKKGSLWPGIVYLTIIQASLIVYVSGGNLFFL